MSLILNYEQNNAIFAAVKPQLIKIPSQINSKHAKHHRY